MVEQFMEAFNRFMREREKLDLTAVYEQLKDTYPLVLTNTFSLPTGKEDFGEDIPVLCGESAIGRFMLYDDGAYAVFDIDKAGGAYTHWHPDDVPEAVEGIRKFMEGIDI